MDPERVRRHTAANHHCAVKRPRFNDCADQTKTMHGEQSILTGANFPSSAESFMGDVGFEKRGKIMQVSIEAKRDSELSGRGFAPSAKIVVRRTLL